MKGQFFIISGLIIVVVLLLIKSSLDLSQLIENKRFLETGLEKKEFSNIRDQLIKTVELSYNKNDTKNVEEYIVYVGERLRSKAIDLNGIAVESNCMNVPAGSDTGLNVTVMNFLGQTINDLNLTFSYDGLSQTASNIADNTSVKKNFAFNTNSAVNYTLTVNYTTSAESRQYSIQIPVEVGKSKFIGFFDLRMTGLIGENRDEFSKVVETA